MSNSASTSSSSSTSTTRPPSDYAQCDVCLNLKKVDNIIVWCDDQEETIRCMCVDCYEYYSFTHALEIYKASMKEFVRTVAHG